MRLDMRYEILCDDIWYVRYKIWDDIRDEIWGMRWYMRYEIINEIGYEIWDYIWYMR